MQRRHPCAADFAKLLISYAPGVHAGSESSTVSVPSTSKLVFTCSRKQRAHFLGPPLEQRQQRTLESFVQATNPGTLHRDRSTHQR